jgi:predicted acyl esterase
MRTFLAGLSCLVAASLLPSAATGAPHRPQDYSRIGHLSEARFETKRTAHLVPMSDGERLYVEIVRPTVAGRFPVLLESSPYHGTLEDRNGTHILPGPTKDGSQLGLAGYFAPRGYAVAFADLRGTGRSEGCLNLLGNEDAKDSSALVRWLGTQTWSNGKVGMIGHSFNGGAAIMTAAQRPRYLKTIVVNAGNADMYGHEYLQGVPHTDSVLGPLATYQALATIRHAPPVPFEGSPVGVGDAFGERAEYAGCEWTQSTLVTQKEMYMSGVETAWHRERDHKAAATSARLPVFLAQGVDDGAVRSDEIDWFTARGFPMDKLWLGQWHHGTTDNPEPNARGVHWTNAIHAWFDRHLKGSPVSTGPPVEIFLNNKRVLVPRSWPAATGELVLHPAAQGRLLPKAPARTTETFVAEPSPFVTGDRGPVGGLVYETAPLKDDVLILGAPRLHLVASTTSPRVHLIGQLTEVTLDGVSPINEETFAINPLVRDGIDKPKDVPVDQMMAMDLVGLTKAHVLAKGSRLQLTLTSSDFDKLPTQAAGARITIQLGEGGTVLRLPIVASPVLHRDLCKSCGITQG